MECKGESLELGLAAQDAEACARPVNIWIAGLSFNRTRSANDPTDRRFVYAGAELTEHPINPVHCPPCPSRSRLPSSS